MNIKNILAMAALLCAGLASAGAADKIKIGFISTLSGPAAALGVDIRDGFNLAIRHQGGNSGACRLTWIVGDDSSAPTSPSRSPTDAEADDVHIMTGIVFSNILLAVAPRSFRTRRSTSA